MRSENLKTVFKQDRPFFLAIPAILWPAIFLYIPLVFLVGISFLKSFDYSVFDYSVIDALTFNNYRLLFSFTYVKILFRSFYLAFFTGFFCLLISYPIAYFLALRVGRFKNLLLFFLVLPFWTNFIVQVYAWFYILDVKGVLNTVFLKLGIISEPLHILYTPTAIYIVMLFCYLPFMVMPIYTSLSKIEKDTLEASDDLGAKPWQTLLYVTWPLSLSGVVTGFFLVYIPSFGEFVIPTLLGGGKIMFVGSLISYFFLDTKNIFLGAAFTCVSGLFLIISALLIFWIFRRYAKKVGGIYEK